MQQINLVVQKWIDCWNSGNIEELPITGDFVHTSPFGVIESRQRYLEIVNRNKSDFLGNELIVTHQIEEENRVCIQFSQKNHNTGLEMDVCEWYELEGNLIKAIRSFYNVGDAEIVG